jgi:hypothetical protein
MLNIKTLAFAIFLLRKTIFRLLYIVDLSQSNFDNIV